MKKPKFKTPNKNGLKKARRMLKKMRKPVKPSKQLVDLIEEATHAHEPYRVPSVKPLTYLQEEFNVDNFITSLLSFMLVVAVGVIVYRSLG